MVGIVPSERPARNSKVSFLKIPINFFGGFTLSANLSAEQTSLNFDFHPRQAMTMTIFLSNTNFGHVIGECRMWLSSKGRWGSSWK